VEIEQAETSSAKRWTNPEWHFCKCENHKNHKLGLWWVKNKIPKLEITSESNVGQLHEDG